MNIEEHKKRHKEKHIKRHLKLHKALDELVADYISQEGILPSRKTILDLINWSFKQTFNPKGDH